MGKARRSKVERRGQKTVKTRTGSREEHPAPIVRASWSLTSFFTPNGPPSDFPGHARLGVLLLIALVIISYYPALMGTFIWDDVIFTSATPVREWSGLWDIWFHPKSIAMEGHYWPVLYTSFWLEHKIWGLEPVGYRVVNTALQALNTLLVWRLMLRLSVPGAWLIAATFAVHPLHVESVAWIIERKGLLSGTLYLGAALLWLRFLETRSWRPYFLAIGLFAMSLLSKTVTITLLAALPILCWWKHGRIAWADIKPLLPLFAVGFVITLGDFLYISHREPLDFDYSLIERAQIAAGALWFYLSKLLWPVDLVVIYPFWEIGAKSWMAWGYVAAALALATTLWLARGRIGRGPMAAAAFFVVTLSPVLGFVDYGYMKFSFVADRYQYLAGIGVMAALIGAGTSWASRLPPIGRRGVLGIALIGVGALATLSWQQSRLYRDEITFFSYIIEHNPKARTAHHNLSEALEKAGRRDEALAMARAAMAKKPDFPHPYNGLGLLLHNQGEHAEAEAIFRDGLRIKPRDASLMQNLAESIRLQGRHEEALRQYEKVIRRNPDSAAAYGGKGAVLHELERHEEAIEAMGRAITLDPNLPAVPNLHVIMGNAALALGRMEQAAGYYELTLQDQPNHVGALDRLAMTRYKQNRLAEALGLYRKYAALEPDHAITRGNIGLVLYQMGRVDEARESLERALALDPETKLARDVLDLIRAAPPKWEL